MKSTLAKPSKLDSKGAPGTAVKVQSKSPGATGQPAPGQQTLGNTQGIQGRLQALQPGKKQPQVDPNIQAKEEMERKKAEEAEKMKLQKKEETSEERFTRVKICEEESSNLDRVFELFVHQQKIIINDDLNKKLNVAKNEEEAKAIKKEMKKIEEKLDWFDSKAIRIILNELGVKEFREHDIDIMIWVERNDSGSR
jgi:hypothetical protein